MMIVKESLTQKVSAGLVILKDNKILLAHPSGDKWYGTYSIPKGRVEKEEGLLSAAIRETHEEVGLLINQNEIESGPWLIEYEKNGSVYKKVYYYIVRLNRDIDTKGLKLQLSEVDWAGFLSKKDAEKRIFPRLMSVLNHIV